jgi:hypothetical protein
VLSIDFWCTSAAGDPAVTPPFPALHARRRALHVGADSRPGCVGPDSISEWASLAGRHKASPAVPFGRGPHPAQEAGFCLNFGF